MMKNNEKVKPTAGIKKGTALRVIKTLFRFYPVMMPVVVVCILFNAIVGAIPAVFMQKGMAGGSRTEDFIRCRITGYILCLVTAFGHCI